MHVYRLFFQKLKNTVLTGLSSPRPNFFKAALMMGIFHKAEIVEFNFSSNR